MGILRPTASRRLNSTRPERRTIIPEPSLPTSKSNAPSGKAHRSPNRVTRGMSASGRGSKISWRRPSRNANGEPGGSLGMSGTLSSGGATLVDPPSPTPRWQESGEGRERFFTPHPGPRRALRASGGGGPEGERDAVHAVAEPGRRRSVVEDVAQVPTAAAAVHLGADHEEAPVLGRLHGVRQRGIEARPAGPALELRLGGEERKSAAGAEERALPVFLHKRARAR